MNVPVEVDASAGLPIRLCKSNQGVVPPTVTVAATTKTTTTTIPDDDEEKNAGSYLVEPDWSADIGDGDDECEE